MKHVQTPGTVTVKVTQAVIPSLWYSKSIGMRYRVVDSLDNLDQAYKLLNDPKRIIYPCDCVVVKTGITDPVSVTELIDKGYLTKPIYNI